MPNQLVKRISREKTEANPFFIYLFITSGFFCWQVTGIQPEPAYVNLLEGRGVCHSTKLWGGQRGSRTSERLGTISEHNQNCHHLQSFRHLLDPCHLLESCHLQDSYHFSSLFFSPCWLPLYDINDYISVSAHGREYDHQ